MCSFLTMSCIVFYQIMCSCLAREREREKEPFRRRLRLRLLRNRHQKNPRTLTFSSQTAACIYLPVHDVKQTMLID